MQDANTVYDQNKPWQSLQENQVSARLAGCSRMTTRQIEAIRPPIANLGKTLPRFGWGDARQPTIHDVIDIDKIYPIPRVNWSGTQAGISSTSYPALGVM